MRFRMGKKCRDFDKNKEKMRVCKPENNMNHWEFK